MKISKIPGLGRFGLYIDDVDFDHITDEEWMEIGQLHLSSLVTIIRDTKLNQFDYMKLMYKWGTPRTTNSYAINKKYNSTFVELAQRVIDGDNTIEEEDVRWIKTLLNMVEYDQQGRPTTMLKVTGKRTKNGDAEGMFAEGELLWHSNESGTLTFSPGVSLLANSGVVGSATGFVTTTDWYESQSESFRSELDDMVLVHKFTPGKINPGLRQDQDFIMYKNMCPIDGVKIPMVIQSPGGIRGLHYSINTVDHVDGMSKAESDQLFERINKELFSDTVVYDHWYQNDTDLCLFDNSITLHRRLGGITNRLCYRIQYDYTHLQAEPYVPYFQKSFAKQYRKEIYEIVKYLGLTDFRLPKRNLTDFIPFL